MSNEGYFGKVAYLSVGDEYDKRPAREKKSDGPPPFKVSVPKGGNAADALFSKKFSSLAQGSVYVDPGRISFRDSKPAKDQPAFRVSNTTYAKIIPGVLGAYPKHEPEFEPPAPPVKDKDGKRQTAHTFTVRPPRKGGAGYAGVGIGPDFKYIPTPYVDPVRRDTRDQKGAKDVKPFVVGGRKPVSNPNAIYTIPPLPPRKAPAEEGAGKKSEPPVAWKPTGSNKKGALPISGVYPPHISEPEVIKPPRKKGPEDGGGAVWKPTNGDKTRLTRPIAYNIGLVI